MSLRSLIRFALGSPLGLLMRLDRSIIETFRAGFVSAAISEGVYDTLKDGPLSSSEIALRLDIRYIEGLKAWLDLGVSLGELSKSENGYAIKGSLSKGIMDTRNDTWQAFFLVRAELMMDYVRGTPARLKRDTRFDIDERYGEILARSSRSVEPILMDIMKEVIPRQGPLSLLEVGCGSGVYIRHACELNPQLRATGLELQGNVAEYARRNIAEWGLSGRVRIERADIREYEAAQKFDLVTFYNLIYYFPREEWAAVLGILRGHLKPGGRLLMSTLCRLGNPSIESMNLWSSMTRGFGPLPEHDMLPGLLKGAGFAQVRGRRLIPGFYFYEAEAD